MTNKNLSNIEKSDDSEADQDNLHTDFGDVVGDSLSDERNYIHPSLSENAKTDELNISQESKEAGCSPKKKIWRKIL